MICYMCIDNADSGRQVLAWKLEAMYVKKGKKKGRFVRFVCPNCGRRYRPLIGGIALEDGV
jgi:hypothetical protein